MTKPLKPCKFFRVALKVWVVRGGRDDWELRPWHFIYEGRRGRWGTWMMTASRAKAERSKDLPIYTTQTLYCCHLHEGSHFLASIYSYLYSNVRPSIQLCVYVPSNRCVFIFAHLDDDSLEGESREVEGLADLAQAVQQQQLHLSRGLLCLVRCFTITSKMRHDE